jgi:putative oxidoreductase
MRMNVAMERWSGPILSVLRIVTALVFLQHGTQKLFGFPPLRGAMHPLFVAMPDHPGLPPLLAAAGLIEGIGGILLLAGLFTRPVAFIVAGQMAVAYFMSHQPHGLLPLLNGGNEAVLLCFVFLYLVFAGPGPWSLDAARGRA